MVATTEQRRALIQQLHAAPLKLVLNLTGGGSLAISDLLTIPGGSRLLLAAHVPYCEAALSCLLGRTPAQACSGLTARQLAMAAWREARQYVGDAANLAVGLGCTASLASDRPKRGDHRFHLALQTARETRTWSLTLGKGQRSRAAEEQLAGDAILNLLATGAGLAPSTAPRLSLFLSAQETPIAQGFSAPENWWPLLNDEPYVVAGSGSLPPSELASPAIFPGSFAPLHDGHRQIAALTEQKLGKPVIHEIAACNVDKPPLDFIELSERIAQFPDPTKVWLTTAPTFVEKARLFPRATFVVGIDTLARTADPRYYHDDEAECRAAIQALAAASCRFLVFGRVNAAGVFKTLGDCQFPSELAALCEEVPASDYRCDLSSTKLRQQVK